ncbi:glycosyltransferase [Pseudoalteromonas sp. SR43-7]|uniref:ATP-grasp fold amidoligase family protein n=1 Tax=Pseudoalteromonas sp. SR43-7 TaxID=2760939 RepID=UPI0015FA8B01|nr:ATP-grasp fold amidoligase family protein [Pseudoalteromonas sp. SR43-7]MBB1328167.1 glycosyltransferase [Pseudoalteromonas sp. SR43-7]
MTVFYRLIVFLALLMPLKLRVSLYYFYKHRQLINFQEPKKYTEKLQVRKLNMLEKYSELSDKYFVRKTVEDIVGSEYLIPLLGVYNSFDEIEFDNLPDSFVIKTNFGSGEEHLEIVKNKAVINIAKLQWKFNKAMRSSYKGSILGETQYDLIPRKLIIEELIENGGNDIEDFKFHIFNCNEGFLQIDFDRFSSHKRNLYTLDYRRLDYDLMYKGGDYDLPSELNLNRLKAIALELAKEFDYVRVDLYLVEDRIYFGEMTFTPGNGFEAFSSIEADISYGQLWEQG